MRLLKLQILADAVQKILRLLVAMKTALSLFEFRRMAVMTPCGNPGAKLFVQKLVVDDEVHDEGRNIRIVQRAAHLKGIGGRLVMT
jgi:hypothetical protein